MRMPQIIKSVIFLERFPLYLVKAGRVAFLTAGSIGLGGYGLLRLLNLKLWESFSFLPIPQWVGYLPEADYFIALAFLFLPLGFSLVFFEIFAAFYLKEPSINPLVSPLEYLSFESARILYRATKATPSDLSVSTNAILAALISDRSAAPLWLRLGFPPVELENQIIPRLNLPVASWLSPLFSPSLKLDEEAQVMLKQANRLRQEHGSKRILPTDLLVSLFDNNKIFRSFTLEKDLELGDLVDLSLWFEANQRYERQRKRFWTLENILRRPPIGVTWVYGYTAILDRFSIDLSEQLELGAKDIRLVGRQDVIDQIERILMRTGENNVLMVGEPGVGKRTIVLGLTNLIVRGKSLPELKYKRVLELNMAELLSAGGSAPEIEATLLRVLNNASRAGNIILYIEDFHNFVGAGERLGRLDISEILKPYLPLRNFQVIASTDLSNFHKYIEPRKDLMGLFEKVTVEEPNPRKTLQVLQILLPIVEAKQNVFVLYPTLKAVVERAETFLHDTPFPEKAIDLLSETVADVAAKNRGRRTIVTPADVDHIVTQKTNIPLGQISSSEKEKMQNLETLMHQDIINQETAVKRIAETMQRLRAGLVRRDKPAGVFLFTGPTGVGKTLTAKILSKTYFGSAENMIRFDMSEFQSLDSIDRFIGSLATQEPGQFINRVTDRPFSVILLDEIEKAHPKILNLFLQVFDEGRLTDVFGKTINLRHNIIISTSNAGSEYIRELVNQQIDPAQEKELVIDYLMKQGLFTPELLNRFDEVVVYHPLTKEQISQVAIIVLNQLAERLREQNFFFVPTSEVVDYVSKIGFDPQFGARPMERAIQNTLGVVIAKKIINKEIVKGQEFTVPVSELPSAS